MERLFGTDGIRGIANQFPIEPNTVVKIGKAVGIFLKKKYEKPKVVVGKDTRLSGYMVETAITSGLLSSGCDVMLIGPMPTPAVSHLIKSLNCEAGVMISASHNPAEHNGIKIFDKKGLKLSDAEELEIEKIFYNSEEIEKNEDASKIGKAQRIDDARGRYIEFVKSTIGNYSLEGLKIVLDCANGAAYAIAPKVFSELGAEVYPININPDGTNINKNCGALYPENMCKEVKRMKANFGVALDGDADRLIVCDEKGIIADGDVLLALFAKKMLENGNIKKRAIVATKISNLALDKYLNAIGIEVVRTEIGDKYVAETMRLKNIFLGGEKSGHLLFRQYNETPDAIVAALQLARIIKESKKTLSELRKSIVLYPQIMISVPVKEKKSFSNMPSVTEEIKKAEKILGDKGRVLVRYSGTEDAVRIMVEGTNKRLIRKIAIRIGNTIKGEIGHGNKKNIKKIRKVDG
ncbi:MAG: phosphoglucosamine mutase [Candidatus Diapherotrites archaeon]